MKAPSKAEADLAKDWYESDGDFAMIALVSRDDVEFIREQGDICPDFAQACEAAMTANFRKLALSLRMLGREYALTVLDHDCDDDDDDAAGEVQTAFCVSKIDGIIKALAADKATKKQARMVAVEFARQFADKFAS